MTRLVVALLATTTFSAPTWAGGFFGRNAVGGIAIDTNGVVTTSTVDATQELARAMREHLALAEGELKERTPLRRISLKGLIAELRSAAAENREVADEVKYLAGMQRVKYVFVYPEQNDIVLAGPGEGWTVNAVGDVVGQTTGLPVLQLEDLLVAMRSTEQARTTGVSCSIDPTEEGTRRMQSLIRKQSRFNPAVLPAIERAMGPQQVTVTGIPATSHFARILVAADYRMKRIAMDLEEAPLRELPSFLDMLANSRAKLRNMMPRWWLACDYEPMARTEDGLGWELRGPGVQVMTEDDFVSADGIRTASGKKNSLAQKWAQTMTANYEELSQKVTVFGHLRNLMDLCVIAAVIDKQRLAEEAGCDLSTLTNDDSDIMLSSWNPPKTVSTQCSFTKRGREYLITASGGVQIESWQVADRAQVDDAAVKAVYQRATPQSTKWWQ